MQLRPHSIENSTKLTIPSPPTIEIQPLYSTEFYGKILLWDLSREWFTIGGSGYAWEEQSLKRIVEVGLENVLMKVLSGGCIIGGVYDGGSCLLDAMIRTLDIVKII